MHVLLRKCQEFWCLWKGKWYMLLYFILFVIVISWRRDPERIRRDIWRCLTDYLVTCVRRHMHLGGAFPSTSRSIVASRSTAAHSAKSHLFCIIIWRTTCSFTPGRTCTNAHTATIHAARLITSKGTSWGTPGNNYIIAINAITKQQKQARWRGTRRRTLMKSQTDAQAASIRALKLQNWKFM